MERKRFNIILNEERQRELEEIKIHLGIEADSDALRYIIKDYHRQIIKK